jgi:hypothetical protein
MDNSFMTAIVGLVGALIGGSINSFSQYFFNFKKQVRETEHSLKETRYKAILILAYSRVYPDTLSFLKKFRSDITDVKRLDEELRAEFFNMILFASDTVIITFKKFLDNPNREALLESITAMRKDLFKRDTKLNFDTLMQMEKLLD